MDGGAGSTGSKSEQRYLYGVSPVFQVETTPVTSPSGIPVINVPHNWSLKPSSMQPGQKFRLLFVTTSRDRANRYKTPGGYDNIVKRDAGQSSSLVKAHATNYKAILSTRHVDAIDHVGMTGTGVPVWWVNGARVADNYGDFWDGTWDSYEVRNQRGQGISSRRVWTGSTNGGRKPGNFYVGTSSLYVAYGQGRTSPLASSNTGKTNQYSFYGISPIFKVDSPPPSVTSLTISESSSSPPDASEGDGTRIVTVTAPSADSRDIAFSYVVEGTSTAESGADYSALPGTGAITAGQTTQDVSISVNDDSVDEPDEVIRVRLTAGTAYRVGRPGTADVVIRDNDPTRVSLARTDGGPGLINEGESITFSVTLGRSLQASETIDVPLRISGAGVTTDDWNLSATGTGVSLTGGNTGTPQVRFSGAGARVAALTLATIADSANETKETITVALGPDGTGANGFDRSSLATNVGGGADPHSSNTFDVEILDPVLGELKGKITFGQDEYKVREGESVTITICSTDSSGLSVRISTESNTATAGMFIMGDPHATPPTQDSSTGDFQSFENVQLTFPGASTKTCLNHTVRIFQDLAYENGDWPDGEDFTVQITSIDGDTRLGGTSTKITIIDDEYTVCFLANTYLKGEDEGTVSIPFRLSRNLPFDVTVTHAVDDLSLTQNVDYRIVNGTHTFRAGGSQDGHLRIKIVDDKGKALGGSQANSR